MSYSIEFTPKALEGIEKLKKSGNMPVLRKIRRLLDELTQHPYTGTGQPEQLKHDFLLGSGHAGSTRSIE